MKPAMRLFLCDDESVKFFGEGPYRLLKMTQKLGSLRAAAKSMDMAYTKAHAIIDRAENVLGFKLTCRTIGGKGGGGSCITDEAKELVSRYEKYKQLSYDASLKYYDEIFLKRKLKIGCVIMASGFSKRFGSNKLLSPLNSRPLIDYVLSLTDTPLIDSRVVVTRYPQIESLCKKDDIACIAHSCEYQSDTVRLGTEYLENTDGCIFFPADQPLVSHESLISLIELFKENPQNICRLAYNGTTASPVIFPKSLYQELKSLSGEQGGGAVIKKHTELVKTVEAKNEYELFDADTPEQLKTLEEIITTI